MRARCKVVGTPRKAKTITGKSFLEVRIRDPKGRLWWYGPLRVSTKRAAVLLFPPLEFPRN
jgi:hypothetical protein